jgi:hypothetical protein
MGLTGLEPVTPGHGGGLTHVVPCSLDNIEAKTGKTPLEFSAMAKEKGYDPPETKAAIIVEWLEVDFGLGRATPWRIVAVIQKDQQQARGQRRRPSRSSGWTIVAAVDYSERTATGARSSLAPRASRRRHGCG